MKIVLSSITTKNVVIISSISVSLISALITAFHFYYKKNKRKKQQQQLNGKISHRNRLTSKFKFKLINSQQEIIEVVLFKDAQQQQNGNQNVNMASEELLELGLNYLNQAIKCWESALGNIESAAYMQSQLLALPSNEHSDLVFKLRHLLDGANNVNLTCKHKLMNSSKTLQIIQSRLALRQQQYTAALLQQAATTSSSSTYAYHYSNSVEFRRSTSKLNYLSDDEDDENGDERKNNNRYKDAFDDRRSLRSMRTDDDRDSYASAVSDVEWYEEDMVYEVTYFNLYQVGLKEVDANNVKAREMRTKLVDCDNDKDFLAKLYAIRLGFDKLLSNNNKKNWLINEGKKLIANVLIANEKSPDKCVKAYENMINFAQTKTNWSAIKDELAGRQVFDLTFYDIVLDFILLDAFDDLENPPGAILAVINNRWLSQNFKETALSTAVWSVLKAKRRILKYPNGFISHFYSITEHLVPTLAWGFMGNNKELNRLCTFLKEQVVEYLKALFNLKKTNYANIEHLVNDIESHTIYYLDLIQNEFKLN